MLEEFFLPRINELDQGDIWFQQDGATAHTSRASMGIREEIANIPADMLVRVMANTRNQCMDNGGRHLSYMTFKTM
ncbi:Transposable element Tc3 transposase [Caligus rogercresseyi]|uniref:Transposable element Tc3 transposase n=1 Tax=Caligus rogercresseyi TaxID=217165 RepID=A0A7T8GU20_CALRO|nr:Transposable element Tc3 transposase [Caligus rogercresseyi]